METSSPVWTRRDLRAHVEAMGITRGDAVMIHASLRSVGRIVSGPDALIAAVLDAIGPGGTLVSYTDWEDGYLDLADARGRVPDHLRDEVLPFDPRASRASRAHGAIAEMIRTWPGALRSANPGASCAAVGGRAAWFVADHALDYGYGERSPFAKLVEVRGRVLAIGAPLDTLSILHHAEHLANIPDKHLRRYEAPLFVNGHAAWRTMEEFDTSDPVVDGLHENYFADIAEAFLAQGGSVQSGGVPRGPAQGDPTQVGPAQVGGMQDDSMQGDSVQDDSVQGDSVRRDSVGRDSVRRDSAQRHGARGRIGSAPSVLVPAADIVAFAVRWLEERCR